MVSSGQWGEGGHPSAGIQSADPRSWPPGTGTRSLEAQKGKMKGGLDELSTQAVWKLKLSENKGSSTAQASS